MHFSPGEPVCWNCLSSCSRQGFLGLAGASSSAGDHSPLRSHVFHGLPLCFGGTSFGGLSQKVWEATFLEILHDKMICSVLKLD